MDVEIGYTIKGFEEKCYVFYYDSNLDHISTQGLKIIMEKGLPLH